MASLGAQLRRDTRTDLWLKRREDNSKTSQTAQPSVDIPEDTLSDEERTMREQERAARMRDMMRKEKGSSNKKSAAAGPSAEEVANKEHAANRRREAAQEALSRGKPGAPYIPAPQVSTDPSLSISAQLRQQSRAATSQVNAQAAQDRKVREDRHARAREEQEALARSAEVAERVRNERIAKEEARVIAYNASTLAKSRTATRATSLREATRADTQRRRAQQDVSMGALDADLERVREETPRSKVRRKDDYEDFDF